MRILGLDPGSRHTGYGLIRRRPGGLELLAQGRLSPPRGLEPAARLGWLGTSLADSLDDWRPRVAVLETPFLGLNPRSLVVLAEARGALIAALAAGEVEIFQYSPAEIKSAVAGSGRADKRQVARMVALQLSGVPADASADATDALAIALCHSYRSRLDRLTGRAP